MQYFLIHQLTISTKVSAKIVVFRIKQAVLVKLYRTL